MRSVYTARQIKGQKKHMGKQTSLSNLYERRDRDDLHSLRGPYNCGCTSHNRPLAWGWFFPRNNHPRHITTPRYISLHCLIILSGHTHCMGNNHYTIHNHNLAPSSYNHYSFIKLHKLTEYSQSWSFLHLFTQSCTIHNHYTVLPRAPTIITTLNLTNRQTIHNHHHSYLLTQSCTIHNHNTMLPRALTIITVFSSFTNRQKFTIVTTPYYLTILHHPQSPYRSAQSSDDHYNF